MKNTITSLFDNVPFDTTTTNKLDASHYISREQADMQLKELQESLPDDLSDGTVDTSDLD